MPADEAASTARSIQGLVRRLVPLIESSNRALYRSSRRTRPRPPAREADMAAFERRQRITFPLPYRAFLSLHNGWTEYAEGFTLIGVRGVHTTRAMADIALSVDAFLDAWTRVHGKPTKENVARYEKHGSVINACERRHRPFLPGKVHFATDFNGTIRFFDPPNRRRTGPSPVVCWSSAGGTLARYPSFLEMMRADVRRLSARLRKGHEESARDR